jgi:hypothetical protein
MAQGALCRPILIAGHRSATRFGTRRAMFFREISQRFFMRLPERSLGRAHPSPRSHGLGVTAAEAGALAAVGRATPSPRSRSPGAWLGRAGGGVSLPGAVLTFCRVAVNSFSPVAVTLPRRFSKARTRSQETITACERHQVGQLLCSCPSIWSQKTIPACELLAGRPPSSRQRHPKIRQNRCISCLAKSFFTFDLGSQPLRSRSSVEAASSYP